MALIRGLGSLAPCPVCLVHRDDLSDVTKRSPRRTLRGTQLILESARNAPTATDKEKELKAAGLRDVEVTAPFLSLHKAS